MADDERLTSTSPSALTRWQRVRLTVLRFFRSVIFTWLGILLLAFQAHMFDPQRPAPHPLAQLVESGEVRVDASTISVAGRLQEPAPRDLGSWKEILQGVVRRLESSGGDVPGIWELLAEEAGGYRSLRYEGRGSAGTHWVLVAYQKGTDDAVYVALRTELRGLPEDLRRSAYQLRGYLRYGTGKPLHALTTRISVTGRVNMPWGDSALQTVERLLKSAGASGPLRVMERSDALWIFAHTPFLPTLDGEPGNIELHLTPEGDQLRFTVGTPYLGTVESVWAGDGALAYTPDRSGQTILAR